MQKCPVCGTIAKNDSQDYCLTCAWEFEYYFDELSEDERERYEDRLNIQKDIYFKSPIINKKKSNLGLNIIFLLVTVFLIYGIFYLIEEIKNKNIRINAFNQLMEEKNIKVDELIEEKNNLSEIIAIFNIDKNLKKGEKLTRGCKGCHGNSFEKKAMGVSKIVNKIDKVEIIKALKGYKNRSYGGLMKDLMIGQVKSLSDEDIRNIVAYISTLKE